MKDPDMLNMDLSSIEARVLATQQVPDPITRLALQLPRKHPMRFALLYGAGPRSLERMASKALLTCATEYPNMRPYLEAIRLECEIEGFENWQSNAAEEALLKHQRENAAIAYAAVEAGLISPEAAIPRVRAVNQLTGRSPAQVTVSPTGRIPQPYQPAPWNWKPEGAVAGRFTGPGNVEERPKGWKPGDDHSYPEDGILRD